MKLGPSLHRIGSDHVNSYLVEDTTGVTVIDAGLPDTCASSSPSWRLWTAR